LTKSSILTNISIFDENLDLWHAKFINGSFGRLCTKISIFDEIFGFNKITIFDEKFNFDQYFEWQVFSDKSSRTAISNLSDYIISRQKKCALIRSGLSSILELYFCRLSDNYLVYLFLFFGLSLTLICVKIFFRFFVAKFEFWSSNFSSSNIVVCDRIFFCLFFPRFRISDENFNLLQSYRFLRKISTFGGNFSFLWWKKFQFLTKISGYALVRPFLYFDRSTSTSLLRTLYFDILSNLYFLLVEKNRSKYSFGRSKVVTKRSK